MSHPISDPITDAKVMLICGTIFGMYSLWVSIWPSKWLDWFSRTQLSESSDFGPRFLRGAFRALCVLVGISALIKAAQAAWSLHR